MGVLTALVASCTVACSAEPSGGTADNAPPAQVLAANGTEAVEQLSGEQARAAVETSAIQDVDVESTLESLTVSGDEKRAIGAVLADIDAARATASREIMEYRDKYPDAPIDGLGPRAVSPGVLDRLSPARLARELAMILGTERYATYRRQLQATRENNERLRDLTEHSLQTAAGTEGGVDR
jgi:hypothetical protein